MKCFIPAWYSDENWWQSHAKPIFFKKSKTEFDDLISLMGMHLKNEQPFVLVLLNYSPDLRTFLHRHDLFDAHYWSLFDEIQGFKHQTPQSVDYRQLNWPEETEFIYMPFYIRAITSEFQYSNIYFSQEGYLIWIESYENDVKRRRYIFDDRGFLSSVMIYDDKGQVDHQLYMTFDGDWVMKEDGATGKVEIHHKYQPLFNQITYAHMTDIIHEWFQWYIDRADTPIEAAIVASDIRHNHLVAAHIPCEQLCFSIFQGRKSAEPENEFASIKKGRYWLVDTIDNEGRLSHYQKQFQSDNQMMRITPFDVQVHANISSQLHEMKIGVWIDGIDPLLFECTMAQLKVEMQQHPQVRVELLSKTHDVIPSWINETMQHINRELSGNNSTPEMIRDIVGDEAIEYVVLKKVPFENQLVEAIATMRLIIDLSDEPDLFLQICSIGAGLPQINLNPTDYVQHGVNGYLLHHIDDLAIATDYFLNHLKNWNRAFAYSMKLAKHYASHQIVKQLAHWIVGDENGA
ncbi:accessory Sec system protein Asp1 [Staphylococcus schleiferi]|uniref:accessory Sec system protein Asp1 n=1 Tax=Staphylococcus sp. 191 TaxID=2070016 RepID=UPI0013F40669|nr:accessory Sec system protein Asp1 [Staphylococcus sp. 191]NHA36614.1 accessory Sec system protein Asp1 [Staphylococcus schleiferi]NHB72254.1 accessory Sec system protein Asp1 [Staphylococcus sp. 191]